jgi:hypothetical protein
MVQAGTIVWLVLGAAMMGVTAKVLVPPLIWLGLAFVLHASRSLKGVSGLLYVWLALYFALAIDQRGVIPANGAVYFAIIGVMSVAAALPFAVDRFVVSSSPWQKSVLLVL